MNYERRQLKTEEIYYQQPSELGEGYGYHLYTSPEKSDEFLVAQIEKLDAYYEIMLSDTNELPLRHSINRSLMMSTGAPLYHLMELEADRRFLDAFKGDKLDVDTYVRGLPEYTYHQPEMEGEYGRFANITGAVNMAAVNSVLESLQDSDNVYRRVWELFCIVAPEFAQTELEYRGYERPADPKELLRRVFANLGGDTIVGLLAQSAYHFHSQGLRGAAITNKLFYHLEELSLAARKKRASSNVHFPHPVSQEGTTPACPFKPTSKHTFTDNGFGTFASLWHRSSGINDFDEISGFCPAVVDLKPTIEEAQYVVEAMHERVAPHVRKRLFGRMYGTSTAAELSLIRSIYLLDKTVIKTLN